MQIYESMTYRLAYETATLELDLIQGAMKKLQHEKERVEDALAAIEPQLEVRAYLSLTNNVN